MPVKDILNHTNPITIIQTNVEDAFKYNILTQSRIWNKIYDLNKRANNVDRRAFMELEVLFEYDSFKKITNE